MNSFDGAGSVPAVAPIAALSKGIKNIAVNSTNTPHAATESDL